MTSSQFKTVRSPWLSYHLSGASSVRSMKNIRERYETNLRTMINRKLLYLKNKSITPFTYLKSMPQQALSNN